MRIKVLLLSLMLLFTAMANSAFDLDVDDDGNTDALTDGLIILRYMFGLSGDSLVSGVIGNDANRTNSEQILDYLKPNDTKLDIDGNGSVDALTDGLLILRDLFGLSNEALTTGVVADNSTRVNPDSISSYISTIKDSDGDDIVDAEDIYPFDPLRTKYVSWGSAVWSETQWDKKSNDIIWNQTIWSN